MRAGIQGRVNRDPERVRKLRRTRSSSTSRQEQLNEDVLEEKSIEEIAVESKEEVLEVVEPKTKKKEVEMYDRVETIRIVSPGSYELNLEKMAESDERIVSVGKEGSYIIDLMSMSKEEPKKKRKK